METVDTSSLDLNEDAAYERRRRRVTQAGRAAVMLIVAAALAGLAGPGPLSTVEVVRGDLVVGTERFARLQAPLALRLQLPPGETAFSLSEDYLGAFAVESVRPAPVSERATRGGVRYVIEADAAPSVVVLRLRPTRFGHVSGALTLADGRRVRIEHWILP